MRIEAWMNLIDIYPSWRPKILFEQSLSLSRLFGQDFHVTREYWIY